ncbi:vinorine synthase [Arachis ipaensis]|uniref:vinorine synthase n=1 Tax=Arachis ipaensis TaxID=130454 RepID=UPI0007AF27E6|nr:vinorine synthase [Arachis ipaensis]
MNNCPYKYIPYVAMNSMRTIYYDTNKGCNFQGKRKMDLHDNSAILIKQPQVVAVMSVPPLKVTEPRLALQVLADDARTIGGCYQVVLYYNQCNEEDNGWNLAGWFVESLAKALLDHPLLAGRLQRRSDHHNTWLEIVSNDSGIRLLEARCPMSLARFLEQNQEENRETQLVFWKEIDHQNPEFSPLVYVQVTNFECGGYSIGISCSLLLAEVLVVDNFLKKWAKIHDEMLSENGEIKRPIFYQPCQKNVDEALASDVNVISRSLSKNGIESMVFKITSNEASFNKERLRELAMFCVEEAEQKLNIKMGSKFSFVVKESSKVTRVESCSKSNRGHSSIQMTPTTWNEFGLYEVAFCKGNTAVHVSCWVASVPDGHVLAVPYPKENVSALIIVSPPR